MNNGYHPPPWNIGEFPEKTEGWIAFQDAMRNDPDYYIGDLRKMNWIKCSDRLPEKLKELIFFNGKMELPEKPT